MLLMIIGASPGSTGGGIKNTTMMVLWANLRSNLFNRDKAEIFNRAIPNEIVSKSISILVFYLVEVIVAVILLELTQFDGVQHTEARGLILPHIFEVISALSTVGLSTGITADLSVTGKIVLVVCMFTGRVGPLILASSLIGLKKRLAYSYPNENVMVG